LHEDARDHVIVDVKQVFLAIAQLRPFHEQRESPSDFLLAHSASNHGIHNVQ
jgi:hypothetical protein